MGNTTGKNVPARTIDVGGAPFAYRGFVADSGVPVTFLHHLMVDSRLSADMARRAPNAQLAIYPDSGHGGFFQHHRAFVPAVLDFLAA